MKKSIKALLLLLCCVCLGLVGCNENDDNGASTSSYKPTPQVEENNSTQTYEELESYLNENTEEAKESIEDTLLDDYKFYREAYMNMSEGQLKDNYYNMLQTLLKNEYIEEYERSLDDCILN